MSSAQLPFDVDVARLAPPAIRPDTVDREDLIARLGAASIPFVAVTAPAGYGKTTLLARWAAVDPRPFAWLSVDAYDEDTTVFLRGIATAIHRVQPIPATLRDALSGPSPLWTRVTRVGNALAAIERPLILALDDLHHITNQDCHDALAALFDYVPPKSMIVVSSRDEPPLPLARWRARGMLLEIRTTDLRLDDREADLLLRGAGVALDASDVAVLAERTEGWAAGLYLASLALSSGGNAAGSVRAFTGHDRFVTDYFRLEVMTRMREHEARFLMRTSVLDSMCGALCDVVLDRTESAKVLESLERSNRFVVSLDRLGEWYRYHHLFRDLLRDELDRSEPGAAAELNRRAMAWCIAKGKIEAAIKYGHAAGDTETVADLVDQVGVSVYQDGRIETLEEWVGWFDDSDLRRFPAIAVLGAWVRALTGHAAKAERLLSLAETATSSLPLSDGSATIAPWVATLRATMMPSGPEQTIADADLALAQMPSDSQWRPTALVSRGIALVLLGRLDLARTDLMAAVETGTAMGMTDEVFIAHAELALIEANASEWNPAARHAARAQRLVQHANFGGYVTSAIVHVAVARIAIHDRRQGEARTAMTMADRLRPMLDHGIPWLAVQVTNELARAHVALGEVEAARYMLAEAADVLRRRPFLGSLGDEMREIGERVAVQRGDGGARTVNLTTAELRLLPYLATHLTFPEIGGRLFITSHTVRSEAKAIYRKLDASSRTEAVERAVDVGLLEPMFPHRGGVAV